MILDLVCAKTLPLLAAKVENVFCILYLHFILFTCVPYFSSSFCIVVHSVNPLFSTLYQAVYNHSVIVCGSPWDSLSGKTYYTDNYTVYTVTVVFCMIIQSRVQFSSLYFYSTGICKKSKSSVVKYNIVHGNAK